MNERGLRQHLVAMLTRPNAHLTFADAVGRIPERHRGTSVGRLPHNAWQLLEHLRICQWDILEFSRNADHVSPEFPSGYWPKDSAPSDDAAWDKSVADFKNDLQAMVDLVSDEANDLHERFKHGDDQTLLREALLLAKHNSYHLGQLAMLACVLESSD